MPRGRLWACPDASQSDPRRSSTRRETTMDFTAKLDDLQKRVADTKATIGAAAHENHEQLKQRIDQAQADTDRALDQAEQHATAAAGSIQADWDQTRADAKRRVAALQAKAQKRRDKLDA